MNTLRTIRERLDLTQSAFGDEIGVTQGNISHYENGQAVPPDIARKIINCAAQRGLELSFDDIYASSKLEEAASKISPPHEKSNEEIRREVDLGYRQPANPQKDAA